MLRRSSSKRAADRKRQFHSEPLYTNSTSSPPLKVPTLAQKSGSFSAPFNQNSFSNSPIDPSGSTETSASIYSSSPSNSTTSASASQSVTTSASHTAATSRALFPSTPLIPTSTSTTIRAIGLQEEVEISSASNSAGAPSAEEPSASDAGIPLASNFVLDPSDTPTSSASRDQLIASRSSSRSSSVNVTSFSMISSDQSSSTSTSASTSTSTASEISSERQNSSSPSQNPAETQPPSSQNPSDNQRPPSQNFPDNQQPPSQNPPDSQQPTPQNPSDNQQPPSQNPPDNQQPPSPNPPDNQQPRPQNPAENQQPPSSIKVPAPDNEAIPPSSQAPEIEAEPTMPPNSVNPAPEREQSKSKAASLLPPVKLENGKSTSQAPSEPLPSTLKSEILDPARTETDGATTPPPSTFVVASSSAPTPSLATSISLSLTSASSFSQTSDTSVVSPTSTGTGGNSDDNDDSPGGGVELQSDTNGSSPPTGAIIGGVIGGIALIALIGLLIWLWKRHKSKKQQGRRPLSPLSGGPSDARDHYQPFSSDGSTSNRPNVGMFASLGPPWNRSRFSNFQPVATSVPRDEKRRAPNGANNMNTHTHNWWESSEKEPVALQHPAGARGRGIGSHKKSLGPQQKSSADNLAQGSAANPFSDAHEVEPKANPQPLRGILKQPSPSANRSSSAELAVTRRSGAHSTTGRLSSKAASTMSKLFPSRRSSSVAIDPSDDRRIKFLSDPFDLEFDLLTPEPSTAVISTEPMPQPLDPRASSVYSNHSQSSSRYASGTTISNWEGFVPAHPAQVSQAPGHGSRDSQTLPHGPSPGRRASQASNSGVGQAL